MASLYKRKDSPHWHLRTKIAGKWESHNSGLRHDSTLDTKRAHILCAERTYAEHSAANRTGNEDVRWTWVPDFLKHRAPSKKTLDMYFLRWRHLTDFFEDMDISEPGQVTREHAQRFIQWRTSQRRPASGKSPGRNTALIELKLLKMVLSEAAARRLCHGNVFQGLILPKAEVPEKPEITDEEVERIEAALADAPQWMQRSWLIATSTGCRLRETRIEMRNVDLDNGTLHFPNPKGGRGRAYTIPIPAGLRPLFEEMSANREKVTLELPFQPSRAWRAFFDELGLRHLCFHCTRVTFVSRLARAGAPIGVAMRLVNHSSELVHRLYRRTRADELTGWADKVTARKS